MFSEGGQKFRALEKNTNVCLAIYEKYKGFGEIEGLQVMIEEIEPVRPDKCPPVIPDSDRTLRESCYARAKEIYGEPLPDVVTKRLEKELHSIISNGFAVMIVGVGGQGTLLTSRILGGIALSAGFDVKLSEVHGMAQRGGSVVTYVRYGDKVEEPIVEEGTADVLIAFERLEALRYANYLRPDGVLIVNDQRIDPMPVVIGAAEYPADILENLSKEYKVYSVDAMGEAKKIGNPRVFNLIVLGIAAQHMSSRGRCRRKSFFEGLL